MNNPKADGLIVIVILTCVTAAAVWFLCGCTGVNTMVGATDDMEDAVDRHKPAPDSAKVQHGYIYMVKWDGGIDYEGYASWTYRDGAYHVYDDQLGELVYQTPQFELKRED